MNACVVKGNLILKQKKFEIANPSFGTKGECYQYLYNCIKCKCCSCL